MHSKHGFSDFSAEMTRMQNYDPARETQKESPLKPISSTPTFLPETEK